MKKGFTGADRLKRGRFELAHEGTIFLDEIGDISPQMQVSLLRVLQKVPSNGLEGPRSIQVDVRVIAATHRDLPGYGREGEFREDLFTVLTFFPAPTSAKGTTLGYSSLGKALYQKARR